MYRTSCLNGMRRCLGPRSAVSASVFRSTARAAPQSSALAHIHAHSKSLLPKRTTLQASLSPSPIQSVHPRINPRISSRFYSSTASSDFLNSPTNVVYATIGLCCAVFAYKGYASAELVERKNLGPALFMKQNMVCSMHNWSAGRWWTLITSSIMHQTLFHLGANMFTLYSLGPMFVSMFGARAFIFTWVGSSISCCGLHLWWEAQGRNLPFVAALLERRDKDLQPEVARYGGAVGASGSLMGLTTALTLVAPNLELMIFPLPYPLQLWVVSSAIAVLSGAFMLTNTFPSVGHAGHLGGLTGGLACGLLLLRR